MKEKNDNKAGHVSSDLWKDFHERSIIDEILESCLFHRIALVAILIMVGVGLCLMVSTVRGIVETPDGWSLVGQSFWDAMSYIWKGK
jgi:hypothetical protein